MFTKLRYLLFALLLPCVASAQTTKIWDGTDFLGIGSSGQLSCAQSGTWDEVGINDSGNSITVDGTLTCNAGTNLNTSALALESGGNLAALAGGIGTEDAASSDGHIGSKLLAVRQDTPANTSGTDGDYEFLQMSAGRLWASCKVDTALPAGTNAIGKLAANSGVDIGDVDVTSIAAGNNNIGDVDVASSALPTGASTSAKQDTEIGHVDGIETLIGTTNTNTGATTTAVQIMDDWDNAASDGASVSGDVAHDTGDAGEPVKIGGKAVSAFPAPVSATNDRVNAHFDMYGRQLTAHIDPLMSDWRSFNATTAQTGADVWDTTLDRLAITSVVIGSYGTTACRLILWAGATADTTYSAGTDLLILAASFAPSTTSKPGLVFTPTVPVFTKTDDHEIHVTTDGDCSIDIAVHGYEYDD